MSDYNSAEEARLLQYNNVSNEVFVDVTRYPFEKYIEMWYSTYLNLEPVIQIRDGCGDFGSRGCQALLNKNSVLLTVEKWNTFMGLESYLANQFFHDSIEIQHILKQDDLSVRNINKYEARLLKEVKHCEMLLLHSNNIFSLRCRKLAEVIKDPWGNPILDRLLKESEVEIGNDELEFFGMETGYLISTRLRKLCESHCEDMALNLVTAFMRCHQMAETQNFNLNATEDQKRFILDVYIALLYKYQKTPEIIAKLKSLTLKEGLDLLNRFAHKRVNISKIWRHSGPIAHLAAQVYITAAVMKPPDESAQLLEGLLETWLSLTETTSECCIDLCVTVRRIIQAADSAIHMYIFCDAFYAAFGSEMKTFIIELFIRALTTDMNDLERQKNEDDTDKVAETTGRLACGFLKLADVLSCNLKVTRECVLTSFSLKPSQPTLNRLVTLAKSSGYEVLDTGQSWKCKLHPPVDDSDEVCYKCSECGDYMTHFDLKSPLNANIALSEAFTEELVELSPQLCDDLVVVLSSPRYQLFNWLVDWKSLHRLCVLYLNDPERTKNIVTELKFVDIDYSMFVGVKCEPEDENINGIERGYERYLEDSYPPESNNELSDDGDDDSSTDEAEVSESESLIGAFQLLPPPMISQSDPKVLKTLRSFRPTLKRSKSIGHMDCRIPPKVFITNKPTPLSPYASGQPTLYRNYSRSNINDPILSLTDSGNHLTNSFTCIDLEDPYFPHGNLNNWHRNDSIRSNQRFAQNSWSRHHFNLNYFDDTALPLSSITSEVPVALNLSLKDRSKSLKDLRTCKDEMNLMSMFRREHANIVRSNCIKNKQALKQHLNSTVSSIDSLDNSLEKKKSSLLKAVSELITPGAKIKLNYVPEGTFETVKYLLSKNLIEVVGNEPERANTISETFSEGICNSNEIINSLKVSASHNNEHLINERIKENYRQTYSNNSKSNSPKFNSNQFEEENEVVMYNNIKLFENPKCMYCEDAETKCICKFRLVCSRSNTNSVTSANSIAHEENDQNNINDAVVHPDNIKNIWDSDLNSIEFVDSEVESVYSEYDGVNVYNPVSSSTQAELCKPLSSTPYFEHSVCDINEVIVKTTRTYEEEDQISVSDDVMIVADFREHGDQDESHIANHIEKSNTKTKMLNCTAKRNDESKMSNHVKKNNYKKKMASAIEKNNNEDKISNDVQKSNNENKMPNYIQNSNNENKMPNNVQESNNEAKMLNSIQKRNNEDKMPNDIQNSNIENKMSNDIQKGRNDDKMPNDFQKRNKEDNLTNDVQKSNNENKMSGVVEKSNDESKILNDVQKSNNENKMPNWCDVSLEAGNLKVTFPDGVENVDKDVNIKTFSNDDDSSLQKIPFKNKRHKINKNRKVSKNSVDKKISKTIPTAIAKNIESNYQKISKKRSRRSNKSKKRIKRLDSSQDEYVPGVKVNIKSAPSIFLRKYVNVKDRHKSGLIDLVKKYKLKEARVVLHRLTWPVISDNKGILKYDKQNVQKEMFKPGHKKATKKSENMNKSGCRGKDMQRKCKGDLKPWPLQDISPKVNRYKDIKPNIVKGEKCNKNLKTEVNSMNPRVVLKRLDFDKDKKRNINSVLAKVPGLNDLQMIRPSSVDRIVQVVQVPGARPANTVPIPNSTQVTPHIQRIGQPRMEKPISTDSEQTTTSVTVATSANTTYISESSPSINILSQQIIRPGNQNCVNLKPRTSPLINILSQQIIKPATVSSTKVNSIPRVISGGDQIISQLINQVRAPTPTLKTLVGAPSSDQNRILQFICKSSDGKLIPVTSFTSNKVVKVSMTQTVDSSTGSANICNDENDVKAAQNTCTSKTNSAESLDNSLPKFQQAFGKSTYHNNVDSESLSSNSDTTTIDVDKSNNIKDQPKNSSASLNVQPVQGGVIYTRQVPVGQTINLIPPGRGQVFRIATTNPEQLSLVKDSVIQGKMGALLAAALQGKPRTLENNDSEINSDDNSQSSARLTLTTRPALVQNARIVKPVLQIPSNVIRSTPQSNLSSTTLEQLREFDMVYKQVKERSNTNAPTESSPHSDSNDTPQQISVTYLNHGQKINCAPVVVVSSYCNVQPAASPSLSVTSQGSSSPCVTPAPTLSLSSKTATKSPKSKTTKSATTHTTKASPIPKPQQKPQEDEHTTQRIFDILAEYAEQLRNSPDLNNKPAPRRRSNPATNSNQNAKRKKTSSKKTAQSSNSLASDGDIDDSHTVGSEDSSCGIAQTSMQDDEQPLPLVNTSESSEASASPKQLILTDSTPNQSHNLIIADSNVGEALKMSNTAVLVPGNYIMPVSMVKGGQQIAVVSGGSKILATVPARSGPNMLLFQSFLNQTRKHGMPTVKYSAIQPIAGITRNISGVTAQTSTSVPVTTQNLTAVTLSPSVGLQKVNHFERVEVNNFDGTEVFLTVSQSRNNKNETGSQHEHSSSTVIMQNVGTKENMKSELSCTDEKPSIATSVIAQTNSIKEEISEEQSSPETIPAFSLNPSDNDKDATIKVEGRVQSVLVATGAANGPMLSHNTPAYNKQIHAVNSISEPNKDEYLRNEGKLNNAEPKNLPNSIVYPYQNKVKRTQVGTQRLDRELHLLSLQRKQAALERELRLQKSLSEECEDLGVDEPSASDLFPEADLFFDCNHSPSFDQSSQDLVKRVPVAQEIKEESRSIGIFCDDEPMRTDFLFEPIEYRAVSVDASYDRNRDLRNGQNNAQSNLTCEDNTLLQTCTSMSDVTIPSPISPEPYADLSSPAFSKRRYSYSNRKKIEKNKQTENWPNELSSSEDTTGSAEMMNSTSHSPEPFHGKRDQNLNCNEELYSFRVVERYPLKDDQECEENDCDGVTDCTSGRSVRRSVRKTCNCCNGIVKLARTRPSRPPSIVSQLHLRPSRPPSRPTSPIKKTVAAKKR
ncbi:hypothetical protein FQA39_LY13485 [Lamprigera yunnana]|nr:hypothetical protein FQA39_LY13485 [Lamprigera yunnana]